VYSNPFVFTLFTKLPGCMGFLPKSELVPESKRRAGETPHFEEGRAPILLTSSPSCSSKPRGLGNELRPSNVLGKEKAELRLKALPRQASFTGVAR